MLFNRFTILLLSLAICGTYAHGQSDSLTSPALEKAVFGNSTGKPEVFSPEEIDALDAKRFVSPAPIAYTDAESLEESRSSKAELLLIADSVFIERLNLMDDASPFSLTYNRHVRSALNNYLGYNAALTGRMLGLSELYFPMFEETLDREGLPLEIKYLAIVESALNPTARSRAGATGLWQFMYGTGKEQGLKITSYIDERKDPIASTQAACKYLKYLHSLYDDWNLALAAYNSGPGNVNKAIRRAGGKSDYWAIWNHLPRETRGYVPAFIAVNYAMTYYAEHGIMPIAPDKRASEIDSLMVEGPMSFEQINKFTNTDLDILRRLNPQYHKDYIPRSSRQMTLVLPIADIGRYIDHQEEILAYEIEKIKPAKSVTTTYKSGKSSSSSNYYSTKGLTKKTYTVRSGDVIGVIADRHGVGLSKLRYWNNISGSRIYPGQKLTIWVSPNQSVKRKEDLAAASKSPAAKIDPNAKYHVIRSGDTLWDIAKLYDGVSVTEIKQWNAHLNFKRLKPGQKVRVSG